MSLLFPRRVGEAIRFGDHGEIRVSVERISKKSRQVWLRCEAPQCIPIDREERWLTKQQKLKQQEQALADDTKKGDPTAGPSSSPPP